MVEIVTSRLRLRPARADDAEAMHCVLSNADAMRYWSTPPHAALDQTREWLESMIAAPPEESFDFNVEHEGRLVGKAGLWRLPEIGFIFDPAVWGRGFAQEALSAIIPAAFDRFSMADITADVDPRNTPCLNLLDKLGFTETGRARNTYFVNGEWCDSVYLALPGARNDGSTQTGQTS